MTPNACVTLATVRQYGRRAVRATAAEVIATREHIDDTLRSVIGAEHFQPGLQGSIVFDFKQPLSDGNRDLIGVQRHFRLKQRVALLIALSNDERHVLQPIHLLFQLGLHEAAFFFHNQNFVESLSEVPRALRFQRPDHPHFVDPQPHVRCCRFGETKVIERLKYVQIALPVGNDAKLGG
ncbi:hypothetical protein D3C75_993440 [compost metagenome]